MFEINNMVSHSSHSIPYSKRRLTRDWHVLSEGVDEVRFSKCTTRRKTLVDEEWLASVVDIHNLLYSDIDFITGSNYEGQCSKVGMEGMGTFTFPHGVVYEGQFRDGMFHGKGLLIYPQGQALNCTFKKGKMIKWEFLFAPPNVNLEDEATGQQLRRVSPDSEELVKIKTDADLDIATYCQPPDRRFYRSYSEGLVGAPEENLTNDRPSREIPNGCYDVGDGFYNPRTKWVNSSKDIEEYLYMAPENKTNLDLSTEAARMKFAEKIPNVPVYQTENWILERCRKSWDEKVGYKPELYEYWFSGRKSERERLNMRSKKEGGKFNIEESVCVEALKFFENASEC